MEECFSGSHQAFIRNNFFLILTLIFCFRGSLGTQNSLLTCRNMLPSDSAPKNHQFYSVDNVKIIKSGLSISWTQMSSYKSLNWVKSSSYHSSMSAKVIINLSSILLTYYSFSRLRWGEFRFQQGLLYSKYPSPGAWSSLEDTF